MANVRVRSQGVGGKWEGLERSVEFCYAILCKEANKVEATDGEFSR